MKNEVFAREKRLSVRDLADKFEKGLSAAADGGANLSIEAKLRELALLEKHVLLEKLTNALESLRGRVTGRNKDDVEDTISMVADLAVKLSQSEGELFEETEQVKKLANFLKQVMEMELELQALRIQLADMSMYSHQLQKEGQDVCLPDF
ncbi:hypothetical protein BVC80_427g1 [Macleaya cordata]|uniref:Uncharacterized protein n=1 Tax=Macleaya cordata TaxID=56857 RepID=A0A200PYG7_MACCD|nr:hypothetical protein BVC80_427g1 [Macleaya cordata]